MIVIHVHFMVPAIFAEHRSGTLPGLVIRQEYVKILDIRLGLGHINLALFLGIRVRLDPKFATISLDVFTGKALNTSVLRIYAETISGNAQASVTVIRISTIDEEIHVIVGLYGRATKIDRRPTITSQTRLGKWYCIATNHYVG